MINLLQLHIFEEKKSSLLNLNIKKCILNSNDEFLTKLYLDFGFCYLAKKDAEVNPTMFGIKWLFKILLYLTVHLCTKSLYVLIYKY